MRMRAFTSSRLAAGLRDLHARAKAGVMIKVYSSIASPNKMLVSSLIGRLSYSKTGRHHHFHRDPAPTSDPSFSTRGDIDETELSNILDNHHYILQMPGSSIGPLSY
ncbi:hypothetical protein C8Q77DRAFT_875374 [Trametes polyzona]|nr:hypothetical protein C8Q77DRAFT_875374 [Trametes polyzona]